MTIIRWAALLCGLLPLTWAMAQDARPSITLKPDKLAFKRGEPLSDRSLVTNPIPLKGAYSWSWESRRHRGRTLATALHPDGKWIATGGYDGTVRIWEVETGKLVRALLGHDSYVYGLDFSPDGTYLASTGSFDGTTRIWESSTGFPVKTLKGFPGYTTYLVWSGDSKSLVVSGNASGDVLQFELPMGTVQNKTALGQPIKHMSASIDGERCAITANGVGGVAVWNLSSGKMDEPFGEANADYIDMAYSPDGKFLVGGMAKVTNLFDAEDRKLIRSFASGGTVVAWSPDSKLLATYDATGATKVWDANDGGLKAEFTGGLYSMHFLPDNNRLITNDSNSLHIWDVAAKKRLQSREVAGTVPAVWQANRPLVTGVNTATLTLWDSNTGLKLREFKGHTGAITEFMWSPDGKQLASASNDKTVRIWDALEAKQVHSLPHESAVLTVAWSPDGKSVASGTLDRRMHIWDAAKGTSLQVIADHTAGVNVVAWSPSGAGLVASGGRDYMTHLYSTKTWKKSKTLEEKAIVNSMGWSPDGCTLAVGYADYKTRIWNVAAGKMLGELESGGSPPNVNAVSFSPNGQTLATGMANHTLQFWNPRTGQKVHTLQTMAPVQEMTWSTTGQFLEVACQDRTTRFFEPVSGRLRGVYLYEPEQIIAVSAEGHYRAEGESLNELYAVVQTEKGQELLSPADFATTYKLKNNPAAAKFAGSK